MTNYTPTTNQVREQFTREEPPPIGTVTEKSRAFDRWLEQGKAEAWEEGKRTARPLPTREEIAEELNGWPIGSGYYQTRVAIDEARDMADAVLALLKGQDDLNPSDSMGIEHEENNDD